MQYIKCPYDKEVVSTLVKNGADINKQISGDNFKDESPLQLAIAEKSEGIAKDFLALGADPNLVGGAGAALHMAVKGVLKGANLSIIDLLLNNDKVNKNLKDANDHTPLFYANKTRSSKDLDVDDFADMKPVRDLFQKFGIINYQ